MLDDRADLYAMRYAAQDTATRNFRSEVSRLARMMSDEVASACAVLVRIDADNTHTEIARWYAYGQNA